MSKNKVLNISKKGLNKISGGLSISDYAFEGKAFVALLDAQNKSLCQIEFDANELTDELKQRAVIKILSKYWNRPEKARVCALIDSWMNREGYCEDLRAKIGRSVLDRAIKTK